MSAFYCLHLPMLISKSSTWTSRKIYIHTEKRQNTQENGDFFFVSTIDNKILCWAESNINKTYFWSFVVVTSSIYALFCCGINTKKSLRDRKTPSDSIHILNMLSTLIFNPFSLSKASLCRRWEWRRAFMPSTANNDGVERYLSDDLLSLDWNFLFNSFFMCFTMEKKYDDEKQAKRVRQASWKLSWWWAKKARRIAEQENCVYIFWKRSSNSFSL